MSGGTGIAAAIAHARRDKHAFNHLIDEYLRSAHDLGLHRLLAFQWRRRTARYRAVYEKSEPLVSICIATYNRAQLLRDRAVRSCLAQTYSNIEIVVVGDACTDETADVMGAIADPRVRFVNLPQRGKYPDDPLLRWMVAGTAPVNHALSLARGDFITHLDDDDEHAPERVESLLACMRQTRADFLYHPFRYETAEGEWLINEAEEFRLGKATTSSIFYHRYFQSLPWDPEAYRYHEPGDWNRLRKVAFLGAKVRRHPGVFLTHYREQNQASA
jgi:glycosyltransferase involved in cell wall biosynthesis